MTLMIFGLILWTGLHLIRSLAPDFRQSLSDRLGSGSKGIITLGILVSVGLMIVGYRSADFIPVWNPPAFFTHLNNLLMLLAFYIFFQTSTQLGTAWILGNSQNPQLIGFKTWTIAHLLVNGDLASIILFGWLLVWAVVEVIASKRTPSLVDRSTAPISSPVVHLALVLVVFAIVASIHTWLGYNPFG